MIQHLLSLDNYATEERKARRKGSKATSEFFTPYEIVKKMADKIPESIWADPTKTFCDPCCGNGQFILYIIWNRIQHGVDWETALRTCYGVELMQDNVSETHSRVIGLLDALNIDYDKSVAMGIMRENLVCSDFFNWDFENWKPKNKIDVSVTSGTRKS